MELPEDDTDVSKHVGVIIMYILLKKLYCALLVEIKTTNKMHSTYIKIKKNSIFKLILHFRWLVMKCKDLGLLLSLFYTNVLFTFSNFSSPDFYSVTHNFFKLCIPLCVEL